MSSQVCTCMKADRWMLGEAWWRSMQPSICHRASSFSECRGILSTDDDGGQSSLLWIQGSATPFASQWRFLKPSPVYHAAGRGSGQAFGQALGGGSGSGLLRVCGGRFGLHFFFSFCLKNTRMEGQLELRISCEPSYEDSRFMPQLSLTLVDQVARGRLSLY